MASRWWLRWPTWVAVFFFFLNVDLVVMPFVATVWGFDGWRLFLVAALAATTEVEYWHWYAGWLARNISASQPAKRTVSDFKYHGMVGNVQELWWKAQDTAIAFRNWFVIHARQQMEIDTPLKQGMLDGAVGIIRHTHVYMTYPIMIGLGAVPFGWAVGIVLNRVHKVPGAFLLLLAVNAMKTWLLGLVYLWLPLWAKALIIVTIAGLVAWRIRGFVREHKAE
ncbi:MAG TPA: hypothetical protein VD862_04330 [Candidatus Paceibacterota bacterium]|nr:hypothetical protein [Candidatus Paceibacterota bacterium]